MIHNFVPQQLPLPPPPLPHAYVQAWGPLWGRLVHERVGEGGWGEGSSYCAACQFLLKSGKISFCGKNAQNCPYSITSKKTISVLQCFFHSFFLETACGRGEVPAFPCSEVFRTNLWTHTMVNGLTPREAKAQHLGSCVLFHAALCAQ